MRKNAPASAEGSEAAGKARNLEKRAFSLPSVSHNVHYTKIYILKIRTFPSRRFLRSGGPDDLGCGILIFGTGNVSSPF